MLKWKLKESLTIIFFNLEQVCKQAAFEFVSGWVGGRWGRFHLNIWINMELKHVNETRNWNMELKEILKE